MSADNLSPASRVVYENTRKKMAASIFFASMGMISLGFCSAFGGQSDSANYLKNNYSKAVNDDSLPKSQISLAGGYGFASFAFFVAFAVFISAAIYISPTFCGTNSEKRMLAKPSDAENDVYGGFTGNPIQDQHSHHSSTHGKVINDEV